MQRLIIKRTNVVIKHLAVNGVVKTPSSNIPIKNNIIFHPQPPAYNPSSIVKNKPNKVINIKNVKPNKIKSTVVKYSTNNIDIDSHAKIKRIRGIGSGKTLAIIANGPSINEIDLTLLNGNNIHTLSINHPDMRIWPTTYWAFFDTSQMRRHESIWNNYDGLIFNSASIKKQKTNSMQFKNLGVQGFSKDLSNGLYIGRSSVYASMQIALWMEYDHIYIFGCDMDSSGIEGKLHFYGTNPDTDPKDRAQRFAHEALHYNHAASILSQSDRNKFIFASSYNNWPFVDQFTKADHKVAINSISKN